MAERFREQGRNNLLFMFSVFLLSAFLLVFFPQLIPERADAHKHVLATHHHFQQNNGVKHSVRLHIQRCTHLANSLQLLVVLERSVPPKQKNMTTNNSLQHSLCEVIIDKTYLYKILSICSSYTTLNLVFHSTQLKRVTLSEPLVKNK